MAEFIVVFIVIFISLVCLIVFFAMASDLKKIASSTKNTELILQDLLELEKEDSNARRIKEQTSTIK